MPEKYDVKIIDCELYFLPLVMRIPLKFGSEVAPATTRQESGSQWREWTAGAPRLGRISPEPGMGMAVRKLLCGTS